MNLIYIDESGNTGLNLKDPQQPIFLLAAMVLHSTKWFALEKDFYSILEEFLGKDLANKTELHAIDLKARRKNFKDITPENSLLIRDKMLQLLLDYEIPIIYRRIIKSSFNKFCEENYGPGIKIDPYIMALPFVCTEVNHFLQKKGEHELGMFIFDEQKENLNEAERSLRTLRLDQNSILKTTNIIEKGFFIDSSKSFAIQITDMATHYIRKYEEHKQNIRVSEFDKQTFGKIKKMTSSGIGSNTEDILEWVKRHHIA